MKYIFFLVFILYAGLAQSQALNENNPKKWYVPSHAVSQFAGDLGFLSVGAGYGIKENKLTIDFLFGYLPEFAGGADIFTLNTKIVYRPWYINIFQKQHYFVPVKFGLYSSYSVGEQYTKLNGEDYPEGYYWWTTNTRYGVTLGQSLMLFSKETAKIKAKEIFYEFGTNDLLLFSFFDNEEIRIYEITHFDCGIRIYF
ncbi:MAG: hypothetical protein KOO66_01160 [Bacteroidales bacterium]|nr:hypothetical protein [Bacteroidales bacterium]